MAVALLALGAAGCGDVPGLGGDGADGRGGGPGSEPRLEGRYQVTLKPQDYDRGPQRMRWRATPRCDTGPCDTTARTHRGDRIRLRFDEDSGRYVGEATFKADCVSRRTGRLLARDAYRDRARITLEPLGTRGTDDGRVVTTFKGRSRRTLRVTRAAAARFGCEVGREERVETDALRGRLVE